VNIMGYWDLIAVGVGIAMVLGFQRFAKQTFVAGRTPAPLEEIYLPATDQVSFEVCTDVWNTPANAKTVVRDIIARAAALPATPRVGRHVPELDDPEILEVPAHSWRVIYQIRGAEVFLVTLVHRRRALAPEQLRG
jgi:plasmid stabilization system protein ParE